jgi:2-aminoadipate transaminase
MFLWGHLPEGYDAMELFECAVREKVVFVPGAPFFTNGRGAATLRLNFSCSEPEEIEQGMERLARAFAVCGQQR